VTDIWHIHLRNDFFYYFVPCSVLVGAASGSVVGGNFADKYGRRGTLIGTCAPLLLGPLLIATATSFSMAVAGRLICGIGIGIASAVVPLYISEIAPPSQRGRLGSYNQLSIVIGILGALVGNVYVPDVYWRSLFYMAMIPAAVLLAGMLTFAPETPNILQVTKILTLKLADNCENKLAMIQRFQTRNMVILLTFITIR
jgi:MFS family permease